MRFSNEMFLHGLLSGFLICLFGVCIFCVVFSVHEKEKYTKLLDRVNIKEIKHCIIDTDECSTNYYKIVWKKQKASN